MFRPGSDGSAERPFYIRNYDMMLETLQQIAGEGIDAHPMTTVKVSRHVDAVYWVQVHWRPEFQWSITQHKTHFDISSMGFLSRFQYRALSMYVSTPAAIEEMAKSQAEHAKEQRRPK